MIFTTTERFIVQSHYNNITEWGEELIKYEDNTINSSGTFARLRLWPIFNLLKRIFYLDHYLFSLLKLWNYKEMICNSLAYREYVAGGKTALRIFISLFTVVILCGEDLFQLGYMVDDGKINRSKHICDIISLVKFAILKVAYSAYIIFTAVVIRGQLKRSKNMRKHRESDQESSLFVVTCLVPIVNNFLFVSLDMPSVVLTFLKTKAASDKDDMCHNGHRFFQNKIEIPLTTGVTMVTSFLQCGSYLLFFPRLRRGLFCCLNQNE